MTLNPPRLLVALAELEAAATAAGAVALARFRPGAQADARVDYKDGGSPVTEADHAANAVLAERLRDNHPDYGWLSEESTDDPVRLACRHVFIVDPIDGTRAFIAGERSWTVCAALVEDGEPIAGVVHAPALGLTLTAARGVGVRANGRLLPSVPEPAGALRIAGPKPMVEWLGRGDGPLIRLPRVPSLAFRLAGLAIGEADAALASSDAHDWDIAAADIILREAGAGISDFEGSSLVYNAADPVHPALVAGTDAVRQRLIAAAAALSE